MKNLAHKGLSLHLFYFYRSVYQVLTHYDLVMPYGDINLLTYHQ